MRGNGLHGNSEYDLDEDQALFDVRFWRAYRLLHFVADRILNDSERAEMAVENCWHSASVRPPHFEHQGAFRSWLVRVLIDEALLLLREKQQTTNTKILLDAVLTRRDTP
jgi:DNA-directed RNA polymerase specialized sigma24 family protein